MCLASKQLFGAINKFCSYDEKMEGALNNLSLVISNRRGFNSLMFHVQNLLNDYQIMFLQVA